MAKENTLTIGVEEEYQIVDPKTRELTSFVSEYLEEGAMIYKDQVQPELLQSQIEIGSKVCNNIDELDEEIRKLRTMLSDFSIKNDTRIVAAGTHPFSHWRDQIVTDKERYHGLFDSMQYVAKRLLIFGMHVHIGIPNKNLRIDVMNQMRYFIPHILALSTSSPFWLGENTGFKSYRSIIFEDLPRTGVPEKFNSYSDYDQYVKTLIRSKTIDEPTKIWWDIRPHHIYPTLEFRICDCCTTVDEAIGIAAIIQALVAKMINLRNNNQTWRNYRSSLISENKWRAMKDGINSKLIDLGKQKEVSYDSLINEILEFIDDVIDGLGSRKKIEKFMYHISNGTSADRQIEEYNKNKDINSVVDMLIQETISGC